MHYATYGFMVFGIIQLVTVVICLIKPSMILTRDLRFELSEMRHRSAKLYFALRMAIFALFGLAFVILASPLVPDHVIASVQGARSWTTSDKAPWLAIPLVLEFAALVGLNKLFTGRIFATEQSDLPYRKPLYIVNAVLALIAALLWLIPSTWTVDRTWNALVIEHGEVVGETTVAAEFKVYDYLFKDNGYSGTMRVEGRAEDISHHKLDRMEPFEFEHNGEQVTVFDGRISIMSIDFADGGIIDGDLTFLIDEDAEMVWIEEFAGYNKIDPTTGEHVLDNTDGLYENPRSYVAYDGSYAEAAELYDMIAGKFDSASFVGLPEGYNPFR